GRKAFMALVDKQPRMASAIIATISDRLRHADIALAASEAALNRVLQQFIDELAPDRRQRLLQSSLLSAPRPALLTALFGSDGETTWRDFTRASATPDRPAPRVVAFLRNQ